MVEESDSLSTGWIPTATSDNGGIRSVEVGQFSKRFYRIREAP